MVNFGIREWTIIGLVIYLLVLLSIGWYGRRHSRNLSGFTISGGTVSGTFAGFSIFASFFSASAYMGIGGFFYKWGWPSFWLAIGVTLVPLALLVFTRPIVRQAEELGANTMVELIADRWESKTVLVFTTLIALFMYISFMVSQLTAAGLIFEAGIGITFQQGVLLGLFVAALYISFGGMWASIITDNVQAVAMLSLVVIVLPIGLVSVGGLSEFIQKLQAVDPTMVQATEPTFWTLDTIGAQPFYFIGFMFAVPYTVNRIIALSGTGELKKFVLSFWFANTLALLWMLSGGIALAMGLDVPAPDAAPVMLITAVLPDVIAGFLLVAILSAIISSVDSILHASGTSIGNDIYKKVIAPARGLDPDSDFVDRRSTRISKLSIYFFAIIPAYFAIADPPELLSLLMYWATGAVIGVVIPPLLMGLYLPGMTTRGIIVGMILGSASYVVLIEQTSYTVFVAAPIGVVISGSVIALVSYVEKSVYDEPSIPDGAVRRISD